MPALSSLAANPKGSAAQLGQESRVVWYSYVVVSHLSPILCKPTSLKSCPTYFRLATQRIKRSRYVSPVCLALRPK
jgi:hypothetical protein